MHIFGVSCKRGSTVYVASPIASAVLMLAFVFRSADCLQRGLPHQAGPAQKIESMDVSFPGSQSFIAGSLLVVMQALKINEVTRTWERGYA